MTDQRHKVIYDHQVSLIKSLSFSTGQEPIPHNLPPMPSPSEPGSGAKYFHVPKTEESNKLHRKLK